MQGPHFKERWQSHNGLPARVLITGCGGMLGSAIYPYFEERCATVFPTDKTVDGPWIQELDVRNQDDVAEAFRDLEPDLVLHLAAETELEFCETHPDVAEATNSAATRAIAQQAEACGATLVYISTAGVFDGTKESPYTENDLPNPIMVYGRTKLAGEHHVRTLSRKHFIVRAGWMIGGGPGKDHKFVSKILEQLFVGKKVIHAVDDKLGTPTYTHDFAMNLFRLLATKAYGTYHMVCEGSGSRFDVACELVRICRRDDVVVHPVGSDFFKNDYFVPRPRSEIMENASLARLGINLMRPWRAALRDYVLRDYATELARPVEIPSQTVVRLGEVQV
jgi:dTDP-4-dehydrorhamnose reductase